MDVANDLSSLPRPGARSSGSAAPSLPTVALSASRTLRAPLRATSQPEMHALRRAGGVPDRRTSTRAPGEERVQRWLRHAQELEAVRVIA